MKGPVDHYPAVVAPEELTSKAELDVYWDQLLAGSQVTNVPVQQGAAEGYEYWTESKKRSAVRKEKALVDAFCRYLSRNERRFTAKRISLAPGAIECDVFDETTGMLFEAKADATDRSQIRMAIGQVLDYAYFGFESQGFSVRKSVLLPERPPDDILALLRHLGLGAAWKVAENDFEESSP